MSKQILRCGTSIGANVSEAQRGQSTPDFASKMYVALKEAEETEYWLTLLHETDYIDDEETKSIMDDCEELIKLLVATTKTVNNRENE